MSMARDANAPPIPPEGEGFSLRRWSRRKLAAAHEADPPLPAAESVPTPTQPVAAAEPTQPLPPVETLTFDSDFRAFMQPHVAEDLKRQALRKLLHDPHFNVMDGLDVYIEDYSIPSPLEPELVAGMTQARYIFNPPPTRVNADGHVEGVPSEADGDAPVAAPEADEAGPINALPAAAATPDVPPQIRIATDHAGSHGSDDAADASPHPPDATR